MLFVVGSPKIITKQIEIKCIIIKNINFSSCHIEILSSSAKRIGQVEAVPPSIGGVDQRLPPQDANRDIDERSIL